MTELPPLPDQIDDVLVVVRGERDLVEAMGSYYTADQMRAYAEAAIKLEREACAKECDEMPQRLGIHCARAIRARSEGS